MTIYDERNVPVLYRGPGQRIGLSAEQHESLTETHVQAQRALESVAADDSAEQEAANADHLLTGHVVVMHVPALANTDGATAGRMTAVVGASDYDEALKEVIAAFDLAHLHPRNESSDHLYPPEWVASTDSRLAEVLADYYSCEQREIGDIA
jgi:hypothetical protein